MATARRSSAKLKSALPKKRILVVEDEPQLKESVRKHLAKRGFDVEATSDSESAIKAIQAAAPDLVCVDLHLPRESGYDVCEVIRNELALKDLRIVLMGESSSPEARAFAEEAGADRYLTKPFTLSQLDEQIDGLLRTEAKKALR
jgi:DNA-binding response OmpR family regulator